MEAQQESPFVHMKLICIAVKSVQSKWCGGLEAFTRHIFNLSVVRSKTLSTVPLPSRRAQKGHLSLIRFAFKQEHPQLPSL